MTLRNSVWYDEGNRNKLHQDLRDSYSETLTAIFLRPSLTKHFEGCDTCQEIKAEHSKPAGAPANLTRRRRTFAIDAGELAKALNLPEHSSVLYLTVIGHQDVLSITVCSPEYDEVPYGAPAPSSIITVEEA